MSGKDYISHSKWAGERALRGWIQGFLWERFALYQKAALFVLLLSLIGVLVGVTIAATTYRQTVSNSGLVKVVGVSVYWDSACTNKVSSIGWGTITPGTQVNKYIYVKNDGSTAGILSMSYGNWTPSTATSFITLTWNCSGYALPRHAVTCAKFVLNVQSSITGVQDFSFKILIEATA